MKVKKMCMSGREWRNIRFALRSYSKELKEMATTATDAQTKIDASEMQVFVENLYQKVVSFSAHTGDKTKIDVTRPAFDWEL